MNLEHFHPGTKVQFAWSATTLNYFKACPRKYYYSVIQGLRHKKPSVNLQFGAWYHKGLEQYDKCRSAGLDHQQSMRAALRLVLQLSYGWESDHTSKNRDTLVRSIVWYFLEFENDAMRTVQHADGPAVELSFRINVDADFMLVGHLDRVVHFMDGQFVQDRKTSGSTIGDYYFRQYDIDNQMSLYNWAGQIMLNSPIKGVVIDAAQIAVGFTRFQRGITYRSTEQLDEWLKHTKYWVRVAQEMSQRLPSEGLEAFPMNDKSCNDYGGCPFRDVCSKPARIRQVYLDAEFEPGDYSPLELR